MLVYGRMIYGGKDRVKGVSYCSNCCKYTKNASYIGRMYWHFFLVPLIPDGPRVRIIKQCRRCGKGEHIPEENLPAIVESLSKRSQLASSAILDGQKQIIQDGEPASAILSLVNLVETMCTYNMVNEVNVVRTLLEKEKRMLAHHLIDGRMMEFRGELKGARMAYQQALGHHPDEAAVYLLLARICMRMKDVRGTGEAYEKALPLSENRYPIYLELLKVYQSTKEWLRLAETYEECFKVRPDLARDRSFYKDYSKACKYGGKQPIEVPAC